MKSSSISSGLIRPLPLSLRKRKDLEGFPATDAKATIRDFTLNLWDGCCSHDSRPCRSEALAGLDSIKYKHTQYLPSNQCCSSVVNCHRSISPSNTLNGPVINLILLCHSLIASRTKRTLSWATPAIAAARRSQRGDLFCTLLSLSEGRGPHSDHSSWTDWLVAMAAVTKATVAGMEI